MICKHYSHWMYSIEPDTNTIVKCRLCYEEMTGRQFNRFSVEKMKCDFCYCIQPVNSSCQNSECTMFLKKHKYYCDICHLWDNKPQKDDYPSSLAIIPELHSKEIRSKGIWKSREYSKIETKKVNYFDCILILCKIF